MATAQRNPDLLDDEDLNPAERRWSDKLPPSDEVAGEQASREAQSAPDTFPEAWTKDTQSREELAEAETEAIESSGSTPSREQQNLYRQSAEPHKNEPGFLRGKLQQSSKRTKYGIAVILSVVSIGGFLGGAFTFFNTFRMDGVMRNVELKSYRRLESAGDQRSDRWMEAYIKMRLMDYDDPGKAGQSQFFRSEQVSTGNYLTDWYKTLRTTSFEQDVFENNGIKFVSAVDERGNKRTARIVLKDQNLPFDLTEAEFDNLQNGNIELLANDPKFNNYIQTEFLNDKEARGAIREYVNDNTRRHQIIKRHMYRKSIQNMTGTRKWTVFEKTKRERIQPTKEKIRNKVLGSVLGESQHTALMRCLLGISACEGKEPGDPKARQATITETPDGDIDSLSGNSGQVDENGNQISRNLGRGDSGELLSRLLQRNILSKVNFATGTLSFITTMDMMAKAHNNIRSGKVSDFISYARGIQMIGVFTTFAIASDQINSGEIDQNEAGVFINDLFANVGSSDAFTKVVQNKGDPSKIDDSAAAKEYCSDEYQTKLAKTEPGKIKDYAYLCADQRINSKDPSRIQTDYMNTVGKNIDGLVGAYSDVRDAPVIGQVLDFTKFLSSKVDDFVSAAMQPLLEASGLQGKINEFAQVMLEKLAISIGAGPIFNQNVPANQMFNFMVQGAAFAAESFARLSGGAILDQLSLEETNRQIYAYESSLQNDMSLKDRYLDIHNPSSTLATSLYSGIDLMEKPSAALLKPLSPKSLNIFSPKVSAASSDTLRRAAKFANIKQYDFPAQCLNLDPLSYISGKPSDFTNADEVLGINASEFNLETMKNSDAWYDFLYGKAPEAKQIESIWNCVLLDENTARNATCVRYGCEATNGIESQTDSSQASSGGSLEANRDKFTDILTLPSGGVGIPAVGYYHQSRDDRWSEAAYGNGTVSARGCGPTSLAMIASTLTGSIVQPDAMAAYLDTVNGADVPNEGTAVGIAAPAVAKKYNLKVATLGAGSSSIKGIVDTISSGGLVVFGTNQTPFTQNGHVLVIRALSADKTKFYVADPADGSYGISNRNTTAYAVSDLAKYVTSGAWGFTK